MLQKARERLNEAFSPGVKSVKSVKPVKVDAQSLLLENERLDGLDALDARFSGSSRKFSKSPDVAFFRQVWHV